MIRPKIILAVTDAERNGRIKQAGADVLELRVDLFRSLEIPYVRDQIKKRRALKIPLLLTVRNQKAEGALRNWDDHKKKDIMLAVMDMVDMVDIELSSALLKDVLTHARRLKKRVIVSKHDFEHTPAHLESIFKKALSTRADIIKLAMKANSFDDVFRMIEFTRQHRKHPLITMSIGPMGTVSRLVLPAAGSLYAYTFLNKPTAPGQIDAKTLRAHLKFYYP